VRLLLLVGIGVLFGTGHWIWAVSILGAWIVLGWLVAWGLICLATNDPKEAAMYATLFTIPPLGRLWLKKRPKTEIVGIDTSGSMPHHMLGDIIERWSHVDHIVGFDSQKVELIRLGGSDFSGKIKCLGGTTALHLALRAVGVGSGYDALKQYVEAYGFQNVVVVDDGLCGTVPEGWRHEVV